MLTRHFIKNTPCLTRKLNKTWRNRLGEIDIVEGAGGGAKDNSGGISSRGANFQKGRGGVAAAANLQGHLRGGGQMNVLAVHRS